MPPSTDQLFGFTREQVVLIRQIINEVMSNRRPLRHANLPIAWPTKGRMLFGKADAHVAPNTHTGTFSVFDDTWTDTTRNKLNVRDVLGAGVLKHEKVWLFKKGSNWNYLLMNGAPIRMGTADGAITAGSSGTVALMDEERNDAGMYSVTAYLDHAESGINLADEDEVFVKFLDGETPRWQIVGRECG